MWGGVWEARIGDKGGGGVKAIPTCIPVSGQV